MGYLYIWTKLGNIIIAIHISCKLKLLVSMYIWTILGNIIAIHISCKWRYIVIMYIWIKLVNFIAIHTSCKLNLHSNYVYCLISSTNIEIYISCICDIHDMYVNSDSQVVYFDDHIMWNVCILAFYIHFTYCVKRSNFPVFFRMSLAIWTVFPLDHWTWGTWDWMSRVWNSIQMQTLQTLMSCTVSRCPIWRFQVCRVLIDFMWPITAALDNDLSDASSQYLL